MSRANSVAHALIFDPLPDDFGRAECGIPPWNMTGDEYATTDLSKVNCRTCLELAGAAK